jgi:proton glutamate symport protein
MIKFLKSPKAIVLAFIFAGVLAWYFPLIAKMLEKPGDMYLALLQMCVVPLLMTSLISAISKVISNETKDNSTKYFLLKYTSILFGLGLLGIVLAELFKTGLPIIDDPAFLKLGSSGQNSQPIFVTLNDPLEKTQSIIDLFKSIFTNNIFTSLQESLVLQIILFSVLVGAAAGYLEGEEKNIFSGFITSGELIFKKLIYWITQILPLGIICIFSNKFLSFSPEIFGIFLKSIICLLGSIFTIMLVLNIYVSKKLKLGYFSIFSCLKDVLIVSASIGSTIATMPAYMRTLVENLNFNQEKTELFIPLSIALYRFGSAFYLGFVATLTAQIFAIPLGIYEYFNIAFLVFFASFAAVSSGLINIGLLAMILAPVGVPSSLAITLFAAIDPIIDPIRIMFTMYMNLFCATLSLAPSYKDTPTAENTAELTTAV